MHENRLLHYLILTLLWKLIPQDHNSLAQSTNKVFVALGAIQNASLDFHH